MNGGTCVDGINSYTCICPAGLTGSRCSTIINYCVSLPCQNGGTCLKALNSYTCTCPTGYDGVNCETVLTGACGLTTKPLVVTDGAGIITSLHYPNNYINNANCQWKFVSTYPSGLVSVQFTDFLLSAGDYVYVYDGADATAPLLVSGSGNSLYGGPVFSTQIYMFVKFTSNSAGVSKGFSASYTSYPPLMTACTAATTPQIVTGVSGTITTPYYPSFYTTLANCGWRIQAAASTSVVRLTFTDFQLAGITDMVQLYDSSTAGVNMIAQLTSTNTNMGPFWSTQQYMYVQFLSDVQYSGRGFNATFVSVTL